MQIPHFEVRAWPDEIDCSAEVYPESLQCLQISNSFMLPWQRDMQPSYTAFHSFFVWIFRIYNDQRERLHRAVTNHPYSGSCWIARCHHLTSQSTDKLAYNLGTTGKWHVIFWLTWSYAWAPRLLGHYTLHSLQHNHVGTCTKYIKWVYSRCVMEDI